MWRKALFVLFIAAGAIVAYAFVLLAGNDGNPGNWLLLSWWRGNEGTRSALSIVRREACPGAPFILPADGYIRLLYGDPRGP